MEHLPWVKLVSFGVFSTVAWIDGTLAVFGGYEAETDADKKEALSQGGRKKQAPQVRRTSCGIRRELGSDPSHSNLAAVFGDHPPRDPPRIEYTLS